MLNSIQILPKETLRDLVKALNPQERVSVSGMSPAVEETLLQVVDEFVMRVTHSGCLLAQHRNSSTLMTQDVRLFLDKVLGADTIT